MVGGGGLAAIIYIGVVILIGGGGGGVVVVYGSWCLIFISLCFKSVIERDRGERLCNFLLQMQITNGHLEYREYNCEFRLFIINLMANA